MILSPGATIGILGAGQLGRMLAIAALKLGLSSHIYAPESDAPAHDAAMAKTVGGLRRSRRALSLRRERRRHHL